MSNKKKFILSWIGFILAAAIILGMFVVYSMTDRDELKFAIIVIYSATIVALLYLMIIKPIQEKEIENKNGEEK